MSEDSKLVTRYAGWTWLANSKAWHYFTSEGNRSLCRKYMLFVLPLELEQGNDDSPDNCLKCRRELARRKEQLAEVGVP